MMRADMDMSALLSTEHARAREMAVMQKLIAAGRLKEGDKARAQRLLAESGEGTVSALLVRLGLLAERDLIETWAQVLPAARFEASSLPPVPPEGTDLLPVRFQKAHRVAVIGADSDQVQVLTADPADPYPLQAIALATRRTVVPVLGLGSEIEGLLERWYGTGRSALGSIVETMGRENEDGDAGDIEHLRDLASEAPVIRLVNLLIQRAVELHASDIHIEPFEDHLAVRYRIDGLLRPVEAPPARLAAAVISRIKILARLNIAERRLPQDGRLMVRVAGRALDVRVSCMPTSFGESVVLRLLDRESIRFDFDALGFAPPALDGFLHALDRPNGIVLVTGPTGSGKTTTLYTALSRLNRPERKIITVEDPVEYQLEGINQIQVKPSIGLDFAQALRSIVRQDPDVIMVGEMRDLETCRIAIQSALTGHLVLSTLHTNSAAAAVTRLQDMGVEDYLLASTVHGILAQRLVRRLDPAVCETYRPPEDVIEAFHLRRYAKNGPIRLRRPRADLDPAINPYQGRTTVLEYLPLDDATRNLILKRADAAALERAARDAGMRTMFEDGLVKALAGETTIEEVLRVTQES
jgi:general secretion pathway protein E